MPALQDAARWLLGTTGACCILPALARQRCNCCCQRYRTLQLLHASATGRCNCTLSLQETLQLLEMTETKIKQSHRTLQLLLALQDAATAAVATGRCNCCCLAPSRTPANCCKCCQRHRIAATAAAGVTGRCNCCCRRYRTLQLMLLALQDAATGAAGAAGRCNCCKNGAAGH